MSLYQEICCTEARSRQPGSFEFPRAWRFWEAGPQSKSEASAASAQPAVELEKGHPNFETELFFKDHSVDARTAQGDLSPAAINTIEQFSRSVGICAEHIGCLFRSGMQFLSPGLQIFSAREILDVLGCSSDISNY